MSNPISTLLRAVADIIENDAHPKHVAMGGLMPTPTPTPVIPSQTHVEPKLKGVESTPPRAEKAKVKRKRGEPWSCCGSRSNRHTADCDKSGSKLSDLSDKTTESKEFRCDDCMWKFETSDLDNVKCINCKSSNVWPVIE